MRKKKYDEVTKILVTRLRAKEAASIPTPPKKAKKKYLMNFRNKIICNILYIGLNMGSGRT